MNSESRVAIEAQKPNAPNGQPQFEIEAPPVSSFRADSSNLDLVRAVAVLSVFFAHLHDIVFGGHPTIGWHFAQMGVLIFFVHTSFVLMLSLERTKLNGGPLFASFYLRRFFRIYPFSIFCVTVAMVLGRSPEMDNPIRHWTLPEYASNLALTTNLTYTDNMVGGLWTLPLEVQMYLALPFLFVIGRIVNWRGIAWMWVASIPLAILQTHTSQRLNVLGYCPCFLAGVLAWRLSVSFQRRFPGWLWPFGFVAVWPLFFLANHENDMYYRWAFCLALGLIIPLFGEIPFGPVRTVARVIARYSYGIYLSHVAVIMWAYALPVPWAAKWGVLLGASVAAPLAAYHLIEHPMIGAGQRLWRHLSSRYSSVEAPA